MELYAEVHRFARDFINDKSQRDVWKKRKIKEAYELLTGEKIRMSCSTCFIEALLMIVKNTTMAAQNYELKKGVVLQAFGQPKKTCTNDTLTDELAEWYLSNYPEKIIFFSRVPAKVAKTPPQNIKIIKPVEIINEVDEEPETEKEEFVSDVTGEALKSAMGEPTVKKSKYPTSRRRKSAAKRST